MTKEQIRVQLQDIFREVFDLEDLELTETTSKDSIEDWDSLEQINILSSAEAEFGVKFTLNEAMAIENAGDIISMLEEKVGS